MWGYLPSKLNSSTNTNYLASPDYATATILNTTACANGTLNSACTNASDSYSITLGARVDGTLPTGTYNHAFTLIAVGNPINYSITYYANDGANGANTTNMPSPNPQTGNAANDVTSITLSSTKPKRTGYELRGWCTVQPTQDTNYPNDQVCTGGTIYQPGDSFGIDQTTVNVVDLYATWWEPNLIKLGATNATMQDMSPLACANSIAYSTDSNDPNHTPYDATNNPNGYHTATLTDNRDGTTKSYTVTKLADGLCWMTTNLNLGANTAITLTSDDTDIPEGTTFTLPASNASFPTTAINVGSTYNTLTVQNDVSVSGGTAAYYSFSAATADTATYSKTNDHTITTSICPKNWDLPANSQYANLKTKGSINDAATALAAPYSFTYGGYRDGADSYSSQTTNGYYWTSRNYNNSGAYWTYTSGNGLYTYYSIYNKRYGLMIRCVASNGNVTINYDGGISTTEYPVTGTTAPQVNVEINSTVAASNGFTKTGWEFNGWNTDINGNGTTIAAETSISNLGLSDGDTVTLYAQWIPVYTITYVNNCYTFNTGCTQSTSNYTSSQYITLTNIPSTGTETGTLGSYNKFTQTNYRIKSWNTAADGSGTDYPVSSTYTVPASSSPGDGITLYAQWVPVFSLIYNGNGADNTPTDGVMTNIKHNNVAEGDYVDLFASNYKRAGYGFAGWSLTQTNTTSASDINSAVAAGTLAIYGPNETFHPDSTFASYADSNKKVTLYAVWVAPETDGNNNPLYFQDFNPADSTYSSMANGSVIALTDNRDNDVYLVAKLADGNWWMAENLRLDDSATITTTNTNNPLVDNGNVALKQTWYQSSSISLTATTADHLSTSLLNKTAGNTYADFTAWCAEYNANCFDQSMLNAWNKLHITYTASSGYTYTYNPSVTNNVNTNTLTSPSHTNLSNSIYSYGNYYNWYSATAGNGTYNTSGNASGDLCPTGWHLPYGNTGTGTGGGNTSGGLYRLNYILNNNSDQTDAMASAKWRTYPNNFIYSGYWNSSSNSGRGNYGRYWSSTASGNNNAHQLSFSSSSINAGKSFVFKGNGYTVRCVKAPTINDIVYFQDFNNLTATGKASVLNSMTEGTSYSLTDKRDGKSYNVAKLADGKVWMRENLALDITSVNLNTLRGNTNASDLTLQYLKGVYSRDVTNDPNGNYPIGAVSKTWTSSSYDYHSIPMIAINSNTSGTCANASRYCVNDPTSGKWSYDSVTPVTMYNITSIAQGKIGVYYNYCAASAGSYCYGNGTSSAGSPSSDPNANTLVDITEDICPAGWRLPTSSSDGEFQTLYSAYSNGSPSQEAAFQTALSTPYSGLFRSGKAYLQGSVGYFWSSTWTDVTDMYGLYTGSSFTSPGYNFNRYFGNSVRCILKSE